MQFAGFVQLLAGKDHSVAAGSNDGVVGAHAAVGMVAGHHLLQAFDYSVIVVVGRNFQLLQLGVEFFQVDVHARWGRRRR